MTTGKGSVRILAPIGSDLVPLGRSLTREGYDVRVGHTLPDDARTIAKGSCDLVLLDLQPPEEHIFATLKILRTVDDELPIVAIGERRHQREAGRFVEAGVYDILLRPVEMSRIVARVNMLLRHKGMLVRPVSLEGGLREEPGFKKIVGSSERIQDLFRSIETVTASDVPVLILGETGTGKELVAAAIHYRGPRRRQPFFAVNCAAIPETLLESELFGHERGAFTSAVQQHKGKIEAANGGTLFLDEIIEMPTATQAKLLRVVEGQVLQRVGGNENIHVDVRLIAATNKDVKEEVKAGRFREDLFYRLGVFPIQLPPLRARKNDIPELAQYFLERAAAEMNRPVSTLADSALRAMMEYDWPGNVRELQNCIRRAVLLAHGRQIEIEHLGLDNLLAGVAAGAVEDEVETIVRSLREGRLIPLQRVEDTLIRLGLNATKGNISEAADKLGISRSTIYRRLHAMQSMVASEVGTH